MGRSSKKVASPNHLFIHWLQEIVQEAKEKNWNSQFTYTKALNSLMKFPLPIQDVKECEILNGFGPRLCHLLNQRLAEKAHQLGVSTAEALAIGNTEFQKSSSAPAVHHPRPPSVAGPGPEKKRSKTQSDPVLPPTRLSSDSGGASSSRGRSSGPYLPRYRSGGYGLLMALREHYENATSEGAMLKTQLMTAAQHHCDSSYTAAERPECHYTAWASMRTLLQRGLVTKTGNPARFSITPLGVRTCEELDQLYPSGEVVGPVLDTEEVDPPSQPELMKPPVRPQEEPEPTDTDGPKVTYLSASYQPVRTRLEAERMHIDDFGEGYLVSCNYVEMATSGMLFHVHWEGVQHVKEGEMAMFLHENDAPQYSTKWHPVPTVKSTLKPVASSSSSHSSSTVIQVMKPDPPKSQQHLTGSPLIGPTPSEEPLFTMSPGQFQIILAVDNREHYGMGKFKQLLLPSLEKKGITFTVRLLPVADFVWIARDAEGREAVLSFAVERKRVDDLAKSIMDGRMKEQKFRVKKSGFRNVFILVEDFGGMRHLSLPVATILQSVANSNIVDGMRVHFTQSGQETVTFLALMTRRIQRLYANCPLTVYRQFPQSNESVENLQPVAVDFGSYSRQAQKTQKLGVREMFAKYLLQLHGLTATKVDALLRIFPTPRSLMEAYDACSSEEEKLALLNRCVGVALSKSVLMMHSV